MKQTELDLFNGTEEDQELRKIAMERLSYDSRTGLFKFLHMSQKARKQEA